MKRDGRASSCSDVFIHIFFIFSSFFHCSLYSGSNCCENTNDLLIVLLARWFRTKNSIKFWRYRTFYFGTTVKGKWMTLMNLLPISEGGRTKFFDTKTFIGQFSWFRSKYQRKNCLKCLFFCISFFNQLKKIVKRFELHYKCKKKRFLNTVINK